MADLIDDDHLDDEFETDCPNCAGEGTVYHCIDGLCADPESGCRYCATHCDWCGGQG